MKNLKKLFFTLLIIVVVLFPLSETISQSTRMKDKFYFGPFNAFWEFQLRTDLHKLWYDNLSYNMMQDYSAHLDTFLWDNNRNGGFFEPISNYKIFINGEINDWNGIAHENSLITEREKVLRPAFGQR